MNHHYKDIRSRIAEPPTWFDEHACPRYGDFKPDATANIYASEIALVRIDCQGCGRQFLVCFSWSITDGVFRNAPRLSSFVKSLHYGDPPNIECCTAGPTMNSIPRRVVEFWKRNEQTFDFERQPQLEVILDEET